MVACCPPHAPLRAMAIDMILSLLISFAMIPNDVKISKIHKLRNLQHKSKIPKMI